jgi:hypothetical protein
MMILRKVCGAMLSGGVHSAKALKRGMVGVILWYVHHGDILLLLDIQDLVH